MYRITLFISNTGHVNTKPDLIILTTLKSDGDKNIFVLFICNKFTNNT